MSTTLETLNDQDLDWIIKTANRLISMRKREAANAGGKWMDVQLSDAIEAMDSLMGVLAARLGRPIK